MKQGYNLVLNFIDDDNKNINHPNLTLPNYPIIPRKGDFLSLNLDYVGYVPFEKIEDKEECDTFFNNLNSYEFEIEKVILPYHIKSYDLENEALEIYVVLKSSINR